MMNRDIRIAFVCVITALMFTVTIPAAKAADSHQVELVLRVPKELPTVINLH